MADETPIQGKDSQAVPAPRLTFGQRIRFVAKVIEIRLRFALILLATFVLIGKWDTLKNYWDKFTRPAGEQTTQAAGIEYYCPMHPSVVRHSLEPDGSIPKCPICSMPLSQRKTGLNRTDTALPAGVTARVRLSPERDSNGRHRHRRGVLSPADEGVRTVGFVAYDESRQAQITTRVSGYVTKLYVDRTFQQVAAGEPVAQLYSPELYTTEQDFIVALERGAADWGRAGVDRLRLLGVDQTEIDALVATQQLIVAVKAGDKLQIQHARQRLLELGRTAAEIDRTSATLRVETGLLIRSPAAGHVIFKNVELGAHVDAGATLFEIADLSDVWVEAEVYESDMSFLHVGQMAEVTIEGLSNEVFHGRVILVHPHVEPTTRTNRVRIELPNPGHRLSPGMYATVRINTPYQDIEPFKSEFAADRKEPAGTDDKSLIAFQKICPVTGNALGMMGPPVKERLEGKTVFLCCSACIRQFEDGKDHYLAQFSPPPENGVLTVPERSVIDTGTKKVVYVEREPGVFDGVEVQLGPLSGDSYPVIKGLARGDRVAAAGAFLIDAESRLNPVAPDKPAPAELPETKDTGGALQEKTHD